MRLAKVVASVCVLVLLGTSLSGCVVVPYGRGGYYHDHYHDRH